MKLIKFIKQEAHSMVLGANQRAAIAEKSFKEASMQVEVLQAEVAALKALVITSTPSAPNHHLHPQLISKGAQAVVAEAGKYKLVKLILEKEDSYWQKFFSFITLKSNFSWLVKFSLLKW